MVLRYYVLQSRGYNLNEGAQFAALSQQVLDIKKDEGDENTYSRLLADSYRFQGIIGAYMGTEVAVPSCKKWIGLLVERIQKYQEPGDIKTLPIAYNETGIALMRVPHQKEALSAWVMSCDTIQQQKESAELPFPFPWAWRGLVTAFEGDPKKGQSILMPIIEQRAKKLGIDDTSTVE